jgi:hypothetical protein
VLGRLERIRSYGVDLDRPDYTNPSPLHCPPMGISVQIQAYGGAIEATCTHPAIGALCQRASRLGLPMIGYVDPYDDTVFNRSQMCLVVPELHRLPKSPQVTRLKPPWRSSI